MKLKYHLYLLFFISISIPQLSYELSTAQSVIDDAVYELYNFRFDESLSLLDKAEVLDSKHPLIPFLTTTLLWQKSQTEEGYKESYIKLKESFKESIDIYKELIKEYPNNAEYYLYLGSSYGLLARIELAHGHWFKALIPTLEGYSLIKKSFEMDNYLYDSYTPMGMSIYYTCMSKPFIKFCAKIVGLDMDCSKSIEYLEYGSEKSYYSWIEANNILSYIYIYLDRDYDKGLDKSAILVDRFPDHPYFPFLEADAILRMKKWKQYKEKRPNLLRFTKHQSKIIADECGAKLDYMDAYYNFEMKEYNHTIKLTTRIIENYSMEFDWLLGLSYLLRAKTYIEIDEIYKAKKDLKVVSKMDFKFPEIEEAKYLLNRISAK